MSAITKPCETCEGRGHTLPFWNARTDCVDCAGTGRVPDVEAMLRAENATLKESLERALVCLYGADATLDDARKVSTVEATLRAELDAARTDNARLRDVAEKQSRGRRAAMTGLLRMARRKIPPGPVAPPVPLDVQAAHEREVSELYATIASVTAERDAARAEVARLKGDVTSLDVLARGERAIVDTSADIIADLRAKLSECAAMGLELGRRLTERDAEVERLTTRERDAETLFQEMGIKFTDWTRVNTWLAGCKP